VHRRRPRRLATALAPVVVAGGLLASCALPPAATDLPAATPAQPTAAPEPSASAPTRPFRPTPTPAPTFASHVVERGDTLIALAERFATTPESLAYWNRARYPSLDPESAGYRPDRIEVGWTLVYLPGQVVDPEDLPPAASVAPATPGPVGGPFPTLPADGSAALVTSGPRGLPGVALTFDYRGGAGTGPGPEAVVQWLSVNGVAATVFIAPAAADPADAASAAVLRRLAAAPGIATGLLGGPGGAALTDPGLQAGDAAVAAALGGTTLPLLRPTTGTATAAELAAAGAAGWRWAVAWDVDPGDGVAPEAGGPIATDIVARVVSRSDGGSIVRLQLAGPRTLEALPALVEGLASAGLAILPLHDVLGR
jgi:hypothetical protein